ncbi:ATPase [Falseniella ignava]|uniref:ATPase n=1 Tax=Falseniella ignava TaxID=137730 RepID=A0A2I1K267_9LACT|nr:siphovirus Gp157 family protein [Falseniella ignava]PKY89723.1 ATPase [Falseniella ignava]
MKLYELADNFRIAEMQLHEAETDAELKEALDQFTDIQGELTDKVENIAKLIKNFEASETAYKNEANRLSEQAKVYRNRINSLKQYVQQTMEFNDINKVSGELFTVSLRNNSVYSMDISKDAKIPSEYYIPQPSKLDRRKLLDHIKDTGELFDGVSVRKGKHIRIS